MNGEAQITNSDSLDGDASKLWTTALVAACLAGDDCCPTMHMPLRDLSWAGVCSSVTANSLRG